MCSGPLITRRVWRLFELILVVRVACTIFAQSLQIMSFMLGRLEIPRSGGSRPRPLIASDYSNLPARYWKPAYHECKYIRVFLENPDCHVHIASSPGKLRTQQQSSNKNRISLWFNLWLILFAREVMISEPRESWRMLGTSPLGFENLRDIIAGADPRRSLRRETFWHQGSPTSKSANQESGNAAAEALKILGKLWRADGLETWGLVSSIHAPASWNVMVVGCIEIVWEM